MIASTGQSPAVLRRDWDMVMVGHMTDYWARHPPIHVLAAGYLGFKPEPVVLDAPDLATNIAALAAELRGDLPAHLRGALDAFSGGT